MIQVFKHLGRTDGTESGGAGAGESNPGLKLGTPADDVSTLVAGAAGIAGMAGGATHFVHIVEVIVLKIIEMVSDD